MVLPIALLIANISGSIVQSNQTHLIVNSGNEWSLFNLVTIVFGIVSAAGIIGALCLSIVSTRNGIRQHRELLDLQKQSFLDQKQFSDYERLIEVYQVFNNDQEREARKHIYRAYGLYHAHYSGTKTSQKKMYKPARFTQEGPYEDIFTDPVVTSKYNNIYEDVERVRATFNHVGSLLEGKLIQEEPLMNGLWHTGRVCWICLQQNIMIERD